MKITIILMLVFVLLAGSYKTPVEDTNTTTPPPLATEVITANDATQAKSNPDDAQIADVVEAIDASDEIIHPTAAPVARVEAIDAADNNQIPVAPQAQTTEVIDASDENVPPSAPAVVRVEAIDASDEHIYPAAPATARAEANKASSTEVDPKTIAFNHSEVTEDQVLGLEIEKDYENGKMIFEVEFYANGFEYDYEIDSETGKIISSESKGIHCTRLA